MDEFEKKATFRIGYVMMKIVAYYRVGGIRNHG
jgi:hypothetical protein